MGSSQQKIFSKNSLGSFSPPTLHPQSLGLQCEPLSKGHQQHAEIGWKYCSFFGSRLVCSAFWHSRELNVVPEFDHLFWKMRALLEHSKNLLIFQRIYPAGIPSRDRLLTLEDLHTRNKVAVFQSGYISQSLRKGSKGTCSPMVLAKEPEFSCYSW